MEKSIQKRRVPKTKLESQMTRTYVELISRPYTLEEFNKIVKDFKNDVKIIKKENPIYAETIQHQQPIELVCPSPKDLRAVSNKLGFDYKKLKPKQRRQFILDCKDTLQGDFSKIKTYAEYLLI